MQKKIDKLVEWLQNQVKEANVKGLVVGISGGIDSAVVTHLIKRAMPEHSLGVMMPCKSNPSDLEDAKKVVESAEIDHVTVDLTKTHDTLFNTITGVLTSESIHHEEQDQLADANLRARLRMSTLYTIATNHQYLVVGTDNQAEWYTGYFTKYGDGGVDIAPLIHLTKGEVREMAQHLGVPNSIIEKKPSAGLWEDQTDENEMGTTYHYIDKYLKGESVPEKDQEIIERMHKRSAHKRNGITIPPK
ncbi:NH(3)-dependent NAD(+) synthetase [Pelagirhabdus alkalitolerans]|uniref:NH(3)-dependent NAD(+) synthetase n=1 Tax=Pelagirhabdus alkalitolerans TaxID=1612202 RepID=A0A1G6HQ88_9BACI|nr:NAD(+) synthase [Pelagirhabdus alkalitolerans]SDB96318.1 NH(3)-dependent NAD(+) synthetase [Pelagirhabdus alkalitolerans]